MKTLSLILTLTPFLSLPCLASGEEPLCGPQAAKLFYLQELEKRFSPGTEVAVVPSAEAAEALSVRESLATHFNALRAEKMGAGDLVVAQADALKETIALLRQDPNFQREGFGFDDIEYIARRMGLDRGVAVTRLTGARSPEQHGRDALMQMVYYLKRSPSQGDFERLKAWTGNSNKLLDILSKKFRDYSVQEAAPNF